MKYSILTPSVLAIALALSMGPALAQSSTPLVMHGSDKAAPPPAADTHGAAASGCDTTDTHGAPPVADTHGKPPVADTHGKPPVADTHGKPPVADTHGAPCADTHGNPPAAEHGGTMPADTHGAPAADTHGAPAAAAPADNKGAAPEAAAPAPSHPASMAAEQKVNKRITELHTKLHITMEQDKEWQAFAGAMLDNAHKMDMVASKKKADAKDARSGVAAKDTKDDANAKDTTPHHAGPLTAVESMKAYSALTKQHAENMDKLVAAFEPLYKKMSPAQKVTANRLFSTPNHH